MSASEIVRAAIEDNRTRCSYCDETLMQCHDAREHNQFCCGFCELNDSHGEHGPRVWADQVPLSTIWNQHARENEERMTHFEVYTICGSMRFYREMLYAAQEFTAQGKIVIMPHSVIGPEEQNSELKKMLDEMHRTKINMCDVVIVISDASGYIGRSTINEIEFAARTGKPIIYHDVVLERTAAQLVDSLLATSEHQTAQDPVPLPGHSTLNFPPGVRHPSDL